MEDGEATLDYGINSDYDGDRWLHSDDPASDEWVVEVWRHGVWTLEGRSGGVYFPALHHTSRNAWFVDTFSGVQDGIRVRAGGRMTEVRPVQGEISEP